MRAKTAKAPAATRLLLAAAVCFAGAGRASANPSMADDFTSMMTWLSGQLVQGLAFNAGETNDPPHEVTDKRIQPDLSIGIGNMPLDKSKFPAMQNAALTDVGVQSIFPGSVAFPNFAGHLRAGLPWRMDCDVRAANMTTPHGYKIGPGSPASGQSNSIGFGVRKHFFGGEDPLLSVGLNYNHVFGHFSFNTNFPINVLDNNNQPLLKANAAVTGDMLWNVNSYGLNSVVSKRFGHWTPFAGLGINYLTGSVRSSLSAYPDTVLISPILGAASAKPAASMGRLMLGFEWSRSWLSSFTSFEIKEGGGGGGRNKSWILSTGFALPFHIGTGGAKGYASSERLRDHVRADAAIAPVARSSKKAKKPEKVTVFKPANNAGTPRREIFKGPVAERSETPPTLIFIQ